jgi:hypothetical protein
MSRIKTPNSTINYSQTTYSRPIQATAPTKAHGPFVSYPNVECWKETDKAIFVFVLDQFLWIPKGQISEDSEVWKEGDLGKLVITRWIAIQKKLLESEPEPTKPTSPPAPLLDLGEVYRHYRLLARKYHPDLNPNPWATEVMSDLNDLWRLVLSTQPKPKV